MDRRVIQNTPENASWAGPEGAGIGASQAHGCYGLRLNGAQLSDSVGDTLRDV